MNMVKDEDRFFSFQDPEIAAQMYEALKEAYPDLTYYWDIDEQYIALTDKARMELFKHLREKTNKQIKRSQRMCDFTVEYLEIMKKQTERNG